MRDDDPVIKELIDLGHDPVRDKDGGVTLFDCEEVDDNGVVLGYSPHMNIMCKKCDFTECYFCIKSGSVKITPCKMQLAYNG